MLLAAAVPAPDGEHMVRTAAYLEYLHYVRYYINDRIFKKKERLITKIWKLKHQRMFHREAAGQKGSRFRGEYLGENIRSILWLPERRKRQL